MKHLFHIKNRGMSIVTQTIFAFFIVVFALFIFFTVIQKKTANLESQEALDLQEKANTFLVAILNNPNCISVGDILTLNYSVVVQGLLDYDKLDRLKDNNEDLWCIENFDFIYNLEIVDDSYNAWKIGPELNGLTSREVKKFRISLPVAIRFNNGVTYAATVSMNVFSGNIPSFYGNIKEACALHEDKVFYLDNVKDISYTQRGNKFFIGENFFFPYFSCAVSNFTLEKGKRYVFLRYNHGKLDVME